MYSLALPHVVGKSIPLISFLLRSLLGVFNAKVANYLVC